MTFSVLQKGVVVQRLGHIYIYNMWISLETSRTESLVIFNLCYQLSFADVFVQKNLIKQNLTSVESGVFGVGKTSTERWGGTVCCTSTGRFELLISPI